MEGSQRAGPAQDGYGTTQRISSPNPGSGYRSVCMRASKRDSRAFPLPVQKVDGTPNRDAQHTGTRRGNMSLYVGGKSPSDDQNWTPNTEAVRATIWFTITTDRVDAI
ncbi:hypothetical protein RRF57_012106 [Xylaria bambusicola]|uniref:Uncharacterized protein n=1 Tax=Xylaria bambusicola TaxID=326684 RepID=A0AAN7V5A3_9PEZI